MAPSSRSGMNSVDRGTDKTTTKFIDWVGSLLLMKKVTEDIGYSVTVKSTALFLNIKWNNHFRILFSTFIHLVFILIKIILIMLKSKMKEIQLLLNLTKL